MDKILIEEMFKSSVHYGHLVSKWNPKMKNYIFTSYNNIHIIDLNKTLKLLKIAIIQLKKIFNNNGKIIFIGTKTIIKDKIKEIAVLCNQFYINNKWLGGTLTNWNTIKKSINKFNNLNINDNNYLYKKFTKKEYSLYFRKLERLKKNLFGIKNMNKLPNAIFVIDSKKEKIAIKEANKLKIPIFSITDTDSNPDNIDYIIPGNDDSIKSISFFLNYIYNELKNKN